MTLTSTGVGIGTTSPNELFEVRGTNDQGIRITSTAGSGEGANLQWYSEQTGDNKITAEIESDGEGTGGNLQFKTRNSSGTLTEAARFDSSQRLLVGTTANVAGGNLVQLSAAGGPRLGLNLQDGSVSSGQFISAIDFYTLAGFINEKAASIECYADAAQGSGDKPGRLVFSTTEDGASSPTSRIVIKNSGTTIFGTNRTTWEYNVDNTQITGAGAFIKGSSTTSAVDHCAFYNPNGKVGSIVTSGSATAYNTSSDYRLKENVVPLTGAADRVNQLQVHRFNFIADPDKTVDGFIAHEVQTIVPEAISGTKDEVDDENNPVYQGIDQSKLVPLLTAALQEALAKIETLEQRLSDAGIA